MYMRLSILLITFVAFETVVQVAIDVITTDSLKSHNPVQSMCFVHRLC